MLTFGFEITPGALLRGKYLATCLPFAVIVIESTKTSSGWFSSVSCE
jgi:hypothetical protein